MKPLHPLLQRAFALARQSPPAARELSPYLEGRIMAAWREQQRLPDLSAHRLALAGACVLLALSLLASYSLLNLPADPALSIVNSAVQIGLHL